jgi:uncharacterized RDD family membrane protein YckC
MKCKRCRATVPEKVDVCPHCGEDLSSLRQLLTDFYSDEPAQTEEPDFRASEPEVFPKSTPKDLFPRTDEIQITRGPVPDSDGKFPLPDTLSLEEPEEEEEPSTWERPTRGGFWIRSMAFATDYVILLLILAIFVVLGFLTLSVGAGGGKEIPILRQIRIILPTLLPLGVVLPLAYFTFFHGTGGQSIGKMIFGLRVIRTDGQPLTLFRALGRALGYILSAMPLFLGFFWVGFSSSKRAWHDSLADTIVIREQ